MKYLAIGDLTYNLLALFCVTNFKLSVLVQRGDNLQTMREIDGQRIMSY
mgnify:CR=1 FL=1